MTELGVWRPMRSMVMVWSVAVDVRKSRCEAWRATPAVA
jgi:hypothetical protein